ncbi:hypothetical protein [Thermogemmatispora sp.]|uniref:hypothetical protein n=1 Tax=Thermogemmatispora sp. TaxID=1968838 RepID=UPI001D954039|nr:hypothetical protein [Thermogemmatispora sp.]MBX5449910.1 hypothetical protein [Thermogemmatispora sp.]
MIMRIIVWIVIVIWVIITAAGYLVSCAPLWERLPRPPLLIGNSLTPTAAHSPAAMTALALSPDWRQQAERVIDQVLENMHEHAWNAQAMTRGLRTGGLFINWKMTDPRRINAVHPDAQKGRQEKHDPQVDLLYLSALSAYQRLHPGITIYQADLQRTLAVVKFAFQNYNLPKGWIYFALLTLGLTLPDASLLEEAHELAERFYRFWYDPLAGTVYDRLHRPPDYNTAHTLECGAALIDAGKRWQMPAWREAGERTLQHIIKMAFDPHRHLLHESMLAGSTGHDQPQNDEVRAAAEGEAVTALVLAYRLTGQSQYLALAGVLLRSLFVTSGLWDTQRGGFYFALRLSDGKVIQDYKETRAQCLTVNGLHLYNAQAGAPFVSEERSLIALLLGPFYEHTYHGYFYRLSADFQIYISKPGAGIGKEDYFTSEAMGCALNALFSVLLPS